MTIMISLMLITLFSLCHVVVATVLGDLSTVIPDTQLTVITTVSPNTTSYVGGYYYSFTEQVFGGATLAINNPGQYSASWISASGKVVAGVGWAPGGNHTIEYEGTFTSDGDTILCVYGWTVSPLVEYYICEAFGTHNPGTGLTHMGTLESDEGTYDVYQTVRTSAWSIVGDGQTFNQFWSIRQSRREGGNITTNNHFVAWKNFGMVIGSYNYQILATESHNSTGTSSVSTTTPTVTHYAQCGGIGWTGGTACVPPWTCQVSNPYFSFCL